jgi:hypothetical protein
MLWIESIFMMYSQYHRRELLGFTSERMPHTASRSFAGMLYDTTVTDRHVLAEITQSTQHGKIRYECCAGCIGGGCPGYSKDVDELDGGTTH